MRIDKLLHDRKEAERRIASHGHLYKVGSPKDLLLEEDDFQNAKDVHRKEAAIISDGGLFNGAVYCLLTPFQQYPELVKCFTALEAEGLCAPEAAGNRGRIRDVLRESGVVFYERKADYVDSLARDWDGLNIHPMVEKGAGHGREKEITTRLEISRKVKGFGEKTSSLFLRMCGAEYIIPIDSIMSEMLYLHGYPCEIPRSRVKRPTGPKQRKTTLKGRRYMETEEFAFDLAGKYGVPGYILQLAFWTKNSTYKRL